MPTVDIVHILIQSKGVKACQQPLQLVLLTRPQRCYKFVEMKFCTSLGTSSEAQNIAEALADREVKVRQI